ncbi:hypothetical protein SAMN04489732_13652 [Amycolatopsis saalfeldensis]|uniref:Uncharacterized protein n=2 Tax=Amycolatopsis saalfeldensis TaxID=394193 RepID=A0A1H8YPF1_9PSEU|nr:hypothetical protein SAMN04489732_13652 [Amycolatopsis saalfeldensis]
MILTQGCDIMRKNIPWVTLAPVYDASTRLTPEQISSARGGKTLHLLPLTAAWTHGEPWFVDLRLELPVEKSALLDREPIEPFVDEVDYRRLSERLAIRRQRPDLPEDVLDHVVGPLFDAVRAEPDAGAALNQSVYEVRLQCNDALTPSVVTVFVLAKDGEEPDEGGWVRIVGSIYGAAQEHGLTIIGPEVVGLDELTARDYVTSALITDVESS